MLDHSESFIRSPSAQPTADTRRQPNIVAPKETGITWDISNPRASLEQLHHYVVDGALRSESWYWKKKFPKALLSQVIQCLVILLTALGGLFPIISQLGIFKHPLDSGLWSSLFIGSAAAVLGLDRFFGFSSGWARYVLTGTSIRRTLEEFRMDWALMMAQLSSSPTPAEVSALIDRAKEFRMAVEGLVLKETQDWVTEFQNNTAQMEKDLKAQLERLKAESEKSAQSRDAASAPGALEVAISNAEKTDHFQFQTLLENRESIIVSDTVSNTNTWVKLGVPPGQYKLTVRAKIAGKPTSVSSVVMVRPNEVAKPEVTIPLASVESVTGQIEHAALGR